LKDTAGDFQQLKELSPAPRGKVFRCNYTEIRFEREFWATHYVHADIKCSRCDRTKTLTNASGNKPSWACGNHKAELEQERIAAAELAEANERLERERKALTFEAYIENAKKQVERVRRRRVKEALALELLTGD